MVRGTHKPLGIDREDIVDRADMEPNDLLGKKETLAFDGEEYEANIQY